MSLLISMFRLFAILTFITGAVYPLSLWTMGQIFWPKSANGSLVYDVGGNVIGSELLGQKFESLGYFWGRPSESRYSGATSGGSQWGPTSSHFKDVVEARRRYLEKMNPEETSGRLPAILLFASGSGLDPHITPQAALYQLNRIAKDRRLSQKQIHDLRHKIDDLKESHDLRFLGEQRINVLLLNIELDKIAKLQY